MSRAVDERSRHRAAIAAHVTIGSSSATEAAIAEGVPAWCAEVVAQDALARVWRNLRGVRIALERREDVA